MKNKILDLRFIIGFFFLLVGMLLFLGSFILHPAGEKTEFVNRWCGLFYIVFSFVMLILWRMDKTEETPDVDE